MAALRSVASTLRVSSERLGRSVEEWNRTDNHRGDRIETETKIETCQDCKSKHRGMKRNGRFPPRRDGVTRCPSFKHLTTYRSKNEAFQQQELHRWTVHNFHFLQNENIEISIFAVSVAQETSTFACLPKSWWSQKTLLELLSPWQAKPSTGPWQWQTRPCIGCPRWLRQFPKPSRWALRCSAGTFSATRLPLQVEWVLLRKPELHSTTTTQWKRSFPFYQSGSCSRHSRWCGAPSR